MRILFVLLIVCAFLSGKSQVVQRVVVGDTVNLLVMGHNGLVQWQESINNSIWNDIPGATTNPYYMIASSSMTNFRYYRAKIIDTLCPLATTYSSVITHKILASTSQVVLGDFFHGGIVFYVDGGGNGLIASQVEIFYLQWGCYGTSIPGAQSLIDGNTNTNQIVSNCSTSNIAAKYCKDLVIAGYNDWFLPSKDQLNYLYLQRALPGMHFFSGDYWSSTEFDSNNAWVQDFTNGNQSNVNKDGLFHYIKGIRSFSPADYFSHSNDTAYIANQPITASFTNQPINQSVCLNGNAVFSVNANGSLPITYQWKKDGVNISGANSNTYSISNASLPNEGNYTCEISNLCRSTESDNAELRVIQLSASAGIDERICLGETVQLNASAISNHPIESSVFSYQWIDPGLVGGIDFMNINNPNASPATSASYYIVVNDVIGCSASDTIEIFVQNAYQNQQICLVSVDTITWKNKIMWEKVNGFGTKEYYVYKEIASNIYGLIGIVNDTSQSYFIDLASQPETFASRYKIAVVDTCNNESSKSFYHNTMNLTIAAFGSTMGLSWTPYIEESGTFMPSLYYIYKGTSPTSLSLMDSIPGTQTSYNDNNVFNVYYYIVGVKKDPPCNLNGSQYSYSNKKDNSTLLGIITPAYGTMTVSPNPFSEYTTISIPNYQPSNSDKAIIISDVTGKVVRIIDLNETRPNSTVPLSLTIDRGDLKSGVYFVELKGDRVYKGKLIVK